MLHPLVYRKVAKLKGKSRLAASPKLLNFYTKTAEVTEFSLFKV